MSGPDISFWQERFIAGELPWDRGEVHPYAHTAASLGLVTPGQKLLVPGCGRGHEVLWWARQGALVTGLDYTPAAVSQASELLDTARLAELGPDGAWPWTASVIQADVLQWSPPEPVDAIWEQTCLCALHPDHWVLYADQLHRWLRPGGRLIALFMQCLRPSAAEGRIEGPPYHCDIHAMRALFPAEQWAWPAPPYEPVAHPNGREELAVVLQRLD